MWQGLGSHRTCSSGAFSVQRPSNSQGQIEQQSGRSCCDWATLFCMQCKGSTSTLHRREHGTLPRQLSNPKRARRLQVSPAENFSGVEVSLTTAATPTSAAACGISDRAGRRFIYRNAPGHSGEQEQKGWLVKVLQAARRRVALRPPVGQSKVEGTTGGRRHAHARRKPKRVTSFSKSVRKMDPKLSSAWQFFSCGN